jgi:TolA-binding protein
LVEQLKRQPKDSHPSAAGDDLKGSEKGHSKSPTRHSGAAAGGTAMPVRQDEASVLFAAERDKTRHLENRLQQMQLQIERLQEQLVTSQKLNDKNKKDCIEAETKCVAVSEAAWRVFDFGLWQVRQHAYVTRASAEEAYARSGVSGCSCLQ